ncbi:unnamed protein product [Echinostoma caproni]|uniref:Uncharacterized protein n=1 Tax=Echinostoma caproni TaxID=27848 RepID=A0A183AN69_9TREM|nr:unnamed protein product [Echinostoma caproni]
MISLQCLSRRGVPPPDLRLHTPLDDTSSVLPTPPPLLLPGPRSPGLFGPITTPSFFAASQLRNESTARTAVLVDSAATYPLTRIYLYGSEELVNTVTWTLRSACPLDRFRAKDGSFHRIWILTGSINEWEKCSLSVSDQSGEPSLSVCDTMGLMSSPTDRKVFGTSHMSAFSAPIVNTPDDAPESSCSGHGTGRSSDRPHSEAPRSYTWNIDWTSFSPAYCLPIVQHLLGADFPEILVVTHCVPPRSAQLVAALVPIMEEVSHSASETDPCIPGPVRRPLFLPPSVTAPTAIKAEPNSPKQSVAVNSFTRLSPAYVHLLVLVTVLHEKALSSEFYSVYGSSDVGRDDDVASAEHRVLTPSPHNVPLDLEPAPNSPSLQQQVLRTAGSDHLNVPLRSTTSDFSVHSRNPVSGVSFVELPWLPVSPSQEWCHSRHTASRTDGVQRAPNCSLIPSAHTTLVSPVPLSSTSSWNVTPACSGHHNETQGAPPACTCESTLTVMHNSSELTSSVEEYYAELPKISQSEVRGLERCIRRLNRPKRPRPRTFSTNSHSSSSPPSPAVPSSSTYPVVACRVPSNHASRVPSSATLPYPPMTSDSNGLPPLLDQLESEAAIYAEVNDALLPESRCSYPPSLSRAVHSNNGVSGDPYDTPYTAYSYYPCLSNAHRRLSQSVTAVQSTHHLRCPRGTGDCVIFTPSPSTLEKSSLNPPFVSRPLPTIVDCESVPCSSCCNHSSSPISSSHRPRIPHNSAVHLPNASPANLVHTPSDSDPLSHPTQPSVVMSSDFTTPQSTTDPCVSQKLMRPSLSALNNLSAAIRRHGIWFRHSISWRARKQSKLFLVFILWYVRRGLLFS